MMLYNSDGKWEKPTKYKPPLAVPANSTRPPSNGLLKAPLMAARVHQISDTVAAGIGC